MGARRFRRRSTTWKPLCSPLTPPVAPAPFAEGTCSCLPRGVPVGESLSALFTRRARLCFNARMTPPWVHLPATDGVCYPRSQSTSCSPVCLRPAGITPWHRRSVTWVRGCGAVRGMGWGKGGANSNGHARMLGVGLARPGVRVVRDPFLCWSGGCLSMPPGACA